MKDFILEKGERALFTPCLTLLKKMYGNQEHYGDQFKDIFHEEILRKKIELETFKYLYLNYDNSKYFHHFNKLCLFLDKDMAYNWENNLTWDKENIDKYIRRNYSELFSLGKPSLLYLTEGQEVFWENWFKCSSLEVLRIVEFSLRKLDLFLDNVKNNSYLKKNIELLGDIIGLSTDEKKQWYIFNVINHPSEINNNLLKDVNGVDNILRIVSQSLNLGDDFLTKALTTTSNLRVNHLISYKDKYCKEWKDLFKSEFDIESIINKVYSSDDLLFAELVEPIVIDVPENIGFEHIQEYPLLEKMFKNIQTNFSLLIEGENNSGKKTLLASLCKKNNVKMFKAIHKNIRLVKYVVSKLHGLLVFRIHDEVKNEFLEKIVCSQAILSEEKTLYLNSIDLVLKLSKPGINQRIELAKKYFKDENIAIKISQRVKSISGIYQIFNICSKINDFSWNYIDVLISNMNNIQAGNVFSLEKWEPTEDLVKFGGSKYLKEELDNLVQYFNEPAKYSRFKVKGKKGLLLIGESGSGKTYFVKNLAKRINAPVYSIESSLLANDVSLIQRTFDFVRTNAPCVLFIDEIDVLISSEKISQSLEEKKIINSLLNNMDGLENNDGVLIIGATHRTAIFDKAALRSGRFDSRLVFSHPTREERIDIWSNYLEAVNYDKNISMEELALLSNSLTSADIHEAVNKAAMSSALKNKDVISLEELKDACNLIYWGETVPSKISEECLLATCYHEAGHVVAAFHSKKYVCDRVMVKPKMDSLGLTNVRLEDGDYDLRIADIYKDIQISLGGFVAEEIIYGEGTTGVSVDMKVAYKSAKSIILSYAMHPSFLGGVNGNSENSDKMKEFVEEEVQKILKAEYQNTLKILKENKSLLVEIANKLFEEKEISGMDMIDLSKKVKNVETDSLFLKDTKKVVFPAFKDMESTMHSSSMIHKEN